MIISLIKGFYPYFTIIAVIGIGLRIKNKEWSMPETILISLWLGHNLLTIFQVGCFGDEWNFSRRYLLPSAPLVFGWAAYAISKVRKKEIIYFIMGLGLCFLVWDAIRPGLNHFWKKSKQEERLIIKAFAPVIKKNWNKDNFYCPELWWDEYRSPKRPLVQCDDSPAVGYYSGGRHIFADSTERILPDYILSTCLSEVPGYSEIMRQNINEKCYILRRKND